MSLSGKARYGKAAVGLVAMWVAASAGVSRNMVLVLICLCTILYAHLLFAAGLSFLDSLGLTEAGQPEG